MKPSRLGILACLAAGVLAFSTALDAAPRPSGGGGGGRPGGAAPHGNPGGQAGGHSYGSRYGHPPGGGGGQYSGGRHYGGSYGGHHYHGGGGRYYPYWGWGVALGGPWGWGWSSPYWYGWGYGYGYPYPAYAYATPYYGGGYGCGWDEECWRAMNEKSEPAPTTELPPPAPGDEGAPVQRPLHLNYCDSLRAWYPNVRSCPGGWRHVRPEYNVAPAPAR